MFGFAVTPKSTTAWGRGVLSGCLRYLVLLEGLRHGVEETNVMGRGILCSLGTL